MDDIVEEAHDIGYDSAINEIMSELSDDNYDDYDDYDDYYESDESAESSEGTSMTGGTGHTESSSINSNDLMKIKKHMDSDAYIAASNTSSKDFKINVNEFYSTDSNTYKGTESGSEYYKMMKHRDRLRN